MIYVCLVFDMQYSTLQTIAGTNAKFVDMIPTKYDKVVCFDIPAWYWFVTMKELMYNAAKMKAVLRLTTSAPSLFD